MLSMLLLALPAAASARWTTETLQYAGGMRTYHKYVPANVDRNAGQMVVLHGQGGAGPEIGSAYEVAMNAERYGFIGVSPDGTQAPGGAFEWNIDNPRGPDEVGFIHAVVADVASDHALPADAPKLALGFSNGAGLASLLGCYDSSNVYVAHVGVHIVPQADYPSTCIAGGGKGSRTSTVSAVRPWLGVGDGDFFVVGLRPDPVTGVKNQFASQLSAAGCPAEDWTETAAPGSACYDYSGCSQLGQLCVYPNTGHEVRPSMLPSAWSFLTGAEPADFTGSSGNGGATGNYEPDKGDDMNYGGDKDDQLPVGYDGDKEEGGNHDGDKEENWSNYGADKEENWSNYGADKEENWSNYGVDKEDSWSDYGVDKEDSWSDYGVDKQDNWSNYGVDNQDSWGNYGIDKQDSWSNYGVDKQDSFNNGKGDSESWYGGNDKGEDYNHDKGTTWSYDSDKGGSSWTAPNYYYGNSNRDSQSWGSSKVTHGSHGSKTNVAGAQTNKAGRRLRRKVRAPSGRRGM